MTKILSSINSYSNEVSLEPTEKTKLQEQQNCFKTLFYRYKTKMNISIFTNISIISFYRYRDILGNIGGNFDKKIDGTKIDHGNVGRNSKK